MILMTLVNIFSFLTYLSLAVYVLGKNPGSSLNRVSSAAISCFGVWSFGFIFIHNHYIPKNVAMQFINICFIAVAAFTSFTLWFYLIFTEKKAILEKKIFYMINFFFPLFFIYLQWKHQAIVEDMLKVSYGWAPIWASSIWVSFFDLYFFSASAVTFYLLIDFRRKTKSAIKRKHATIILTTKGIAFTLGSITDFFLSQSGIHVIPIMGNIFILIWVAGLVYSIARYKLFTVNLATAAENIISTMNDCLILLDTKGTIQLANEACLDILGYSENQLKGKPLTTLLPHGQLQNKHLREMINGKEFKNFYLTLRAKNGAQISASLSTSVLQDEEANIAGIVWIARDISERKIAEELLQESEAKYLTLVERAKDGVVVVQDEACQFVNRAMSEITGYTTEELLGKTLFDLVAPEDRDTIAKSYRLRMEGEKVPAFYEAKFQCRRGLIKNVELSAAVIRYNERPADMLVIRDITDRKRAEEEKNKIQEQLLQSQKMEAIGILAGGVAHDFNNLLTTIQGYTSLAMMNIPDSDPVSRDLNQVRQAAGRAANLTRQLLLFSRKQPMEPASVDLNDLVNNLLKMLYRLIGEDITITTALESHLWPVLADEGTIEQVIMNLAVNARDAMPNGGSLTIKTENVTLNKENSQVISEARPGQFVCILIADTGWGMDAKTVERIFEPFFTTKEAGKGTGLGLSVVYGIVKQHRGWINVYSSPGKGSVFKVYLPAFLTRAHREAKEEIPLQEFQGKGERILVVEDEETVRKLTVRMLRKNNYKVDEASNGQEALNIFEQERGKYHLVLSDVVLPDQTGLELVDKLLLRQPELRVLLMSGYTDHKSQWPAIKKMGVRFLQKPYALPDLLRALREIIEAGKVKV
jgi:PAS domain S-box-containing protein